MSIVSKLSSIYMFFTCYGAPPTQHFLPHPFPPRRPSDLPPVEGLEGRALKPQPRTAKAGAIIEVIAAATFVEGHIIGIDHATDLERGRARRVGKGDRRSRRLNCSH